jgi:hypothetical protein
MGEFRRVGECAKGKLMEFNSLTIAVFSEEKQPGDRRQHARILVDRAAVP